VLTSINQLLKAPQFGEGHRIASIAYGKLYREDEFGNAGDSELVW
jgi:hypothetical protein